MTDKEYNQLLKFVYFEGYADSYAEAEALLEEVSDEEFDAILDDFLSEGRVESWNTPEMLEKSRKWKRKYLRTSREEKAARKELAHKLASQPEASNTMKPDKVVLGNKAPKESSGPSWKEKLSKIVKEESEIIAEYLFEEGYADSIESAEVIAACISESWVEEILESVV